MNDLKTIVLPQVKAAIEERQPKVSGKGLSTNDYDAAAKAKVDAIPVNPQYTDTTYSNATPSTSGSGGTDGLMSAADKEKLNGITAGATPHQAPTSTEITTALGYTPYSAANPNGYTNNTGTVTGIKVGSEGSAIEPSSGVVTIPAYETGADVTDAENVKAALGTSSTADGTFLAKDGSWAVPANDNTTYILDVGTGADADKIVLTPSSGSADKITVPYATTAGSAPASDVSSWAKQASKPGYAYGEIGYEVATSVAQTQTIGIDGTKPIQIITINLPSGTTTVTSVAFGQSNGEYLLPETGHICHVLFTSSVDVDVALSHVTTGSVMYICPNGESGTISVPAGGYAEVSFLRGADVNNVPQIYVRGI